MLTQTGATDQLRRSGVRQGDVVMLHNSFRALGPVDGGPDAVVGAFSDAVGPGGTVLFPTFNFSAWTEQHYWDARETPSEMGALTEFARLRPEARRTPHPIYSFAALGADADAFAACDDPEAFGDGSVFALFQERDGLLLSIGLDLDRSFTLIHRVEIMNGATHRRIKRFGGLYVDGDGVVAPRLYTMFVRRRGIATATGPAMREVVDRGVVAEHVGGLGDATVHAVRAGAFTDAVAEIVRERPGLLRTVSERA